MEGKKSRFNRVPQHLLEAGSAMLLAAAAFSGAVNGSHQTVEAAGALLEVQPNLRGDIKLDLGVEFRQSTDAVLDLPFPLYFAGATTEFKGFDAEKEMRAPDQFLTTLAEASSAAEASARQQFSRAAVLGGICFMGAYGGIVFVRRRYGAKILPSATALGLSATMLYGQWPALNETEFEEAQWRPVKDFIPAQYTPTVADKLPKGLLGIYVKGANAQVKEAIQFITEEKIVKPTQFFEDATSSLKQETSKKIPPKIENEIRIIVYSDVHGNVFAQDYLAELAAVTEADIVVFLGDNTLGVQDSLDKEAMLPILQAIRRVNPDTAILAVQGNHDGSGWFEPFEAVDAIVLNGATEVKGLNIYGAPDNTHTQFGGETKYISDDDSTYGQKLKESMCNDADGAPINAAFVHRPVFGEMLVQAACTQLVASGHIHSQKNPIAIEQRSTRTYQMVNGSSTGAGQGIPGKPDSQAVSTMLSYEYSDGVFVLGGWQTYQMNGKETHASDFTAVKRPWTSREVVRVSKLPRNIPR